MDKQEWKIIVEALFLREAMMVNMGKLRDAAITQKIRGKAESEVSVAGYFEEEEQPRPASGGGEG